MITPVFLPIPVDISLSEFTPTMRILLITIMSLITLPCIIFIAQLILKEKSITLDIVFLWCIEIAFFIMWVLIIIGLILV